jgi:Membrane protein involved in the export of O-antigen and teichoic acid
MNCFTIKQIKDLIASRFAQGVIWNLSSFATLALAGILLNMLIGRYYGADVLGEFNQVYAVYILFSQLAVWGVNVSTLRYTAQNQDATETGSILSSALLLSLITSTVASLFMYYSASAFAQLFDSPIIEKGIHLASLGLILYSLNKVILGALNGMRHMRSFAVFQASRYVLLVLFLIIFVIKNIDPSYISGILTLAELILFISMSVYLLIDCPPSKVKKIWLKHHFNFGYRAFWGGMASELNTRIDIIILGIFCSDGIVGIYSFVAMLAEGYIQLIVVFRNNLNPLLAQHLNRGSLAEMLLKKQRLMKWIWLFMLISGFVIALLYPLICRYIVGLIFMSGLVPLIIMLFCILLVSGYLSFANILSQGGMPEKESMLTVIAVLVNTVLNFVLVPFIGMHGSAIATSIALIVYTLVLRRLTRKYLDIAL